MERDWDTFLAPYELAVAELKIKLRGLRKQYRTSGGMFRSSLLLDE